jgi:hypothetical protein
MLEHVQADSKVQAIMTPEHDGLCVFEGEGTWPSAEGKGEAQCGRDANELQGCGCFCP